MSSGYASRLSEYPFKGVCGLPEVEESQAESNAKMTKLLDLIKKIRNDKRSDPKIVVLTGAGISTAAGINDFRGTNGVWTIEEKIDKEEFLTFK